MSVITSTIRPLLEDMPTSGWTAGLVSRDTHVGPLPSNAARLMTLGYSSDRTNAGRGLAHAVGVTYGSAAELRCKPAKFLAQLGEEALGASPVK